MGVTQRLKTAVKAHDAAKNGLSEFVHVLDRGSWNPATGDGLPHALRADWNARLAISALVDRLAVLEEWWEDVEAVRGGADPLKVANGQGERGPRQVDGERVPPVRAPRYARGKRAHIVAQLLAAAAGEPPASRVATREPDRRAAVHAMRNVSVRAVTVDPEHPAPRRAKFHRAIDAGAREVARERLRRCMICAAQLSRSNTSRLCAGCARCTRPSKLDALEDARTEALRELFDRLRLVIEPLAPPADHGGWGVALPAASGPPAQPGLAARPTATAEARRRWRRGGGASPPGRGERLTSTDGRPPF